MMLILKGIMDKIPPFEKYWTYMFQNRSIPVVGECQIFIYFHLVNCVMRSSHHSMTQTKIHLS